MKNILKIITLIVATFFVTVSCDYDDSNWDMLTKAPDANATYYVQFKNASKTLDTGVSLTGELIEISTTIEVALLGTPLSSPLEINLAIDASTTLEANMYTLSSSKITIPAGKTSGSITITSIASEMPVDVPLKFVLNISQGENNAPAGTQLIYNLKRANFCPWTVDDMVGTYTGTDDDPYYGGTVSGAKFEVFKVDATHIAVSGIMQSLYSVAWGEAITGGDRVVFTYLPNGEFTTDNQYLLQTDDKWDYYFGPSEQTIKWDGCSATITIPYYFHWDAGYGDNMPGLSIMTKD